MKSFDQLNLSNELLRSLHELNFHHMTPIQEQAIEPLLTGENIIAKAITGSGKTGAYGIPISEAITWEENKPQALVIAPSRELVIQISEDIKLMGRYKRIKTLPIFGRDSIKSQILALKQKNHVIVATPGRLMDLVERGNVSLEKLKYLVLDEADELLKPEFLRQLANVFQVLPSNCTIALFSATLTDDVKALQTFIPTTFTLFDTSPIEQPLIKEYAFSLEDTEKLDTLLMHIKNYPNQGGIIFVSTKNKADKLYKNLYKQNIAATIIHSDLEQRTRIHNMNAFKNGQYTYLIATDVGARGIDVDGINLVINYDLPCDITNYTHRIGRIGRNGTIGTAMNYISESQLSLSKKIETMTGREFNYDDISDLKSCASTLETQSNTTNNTSNPDMKPTNRKIKGEGINLDITKLYINGGKRKKLRATDIVGTICSIPELTPDDIGIIEIKENETYVEIMNNKYQLALSGLTTRNIKGRKYKIHVAK